MEAIWLQMIGIRVTLCGLSSWLQYGQLSVWGYYWTALTCCLTLVLSIRAKHFWHKGWKQAPTTVSFEETRHIEQLNSDWMISNSALISLYEVFLKGALFLGICCGMLFDIMWLVCWFGMLCNLDLIFNLFIIIKKKRRSFIISGSETTELLLRVWVYMNSVASEILIPTEFYQNFYYVFAL